MERFNTYIESSSIHGVSHIAKSRNALKLFWIFVVFSGFLIAGVLIHQSFKSWNENPIRTTIETVPITEMVLPNITVCPPKDTYTDLNYELKLAENMTINNKTREGLFNFAMDLLLDAHFLELMKNQSVLQEDHGYSNWYHGFTEIVRVTYDGGDGQLYLYFSTTATFGNISTPDFGKKFNSSKIHPNVRLYIVIEYPENIDNDTILTIEFEINPMKSISKGYDRFYIEWDLAKEIFVTKNYTMPTPSYPFMRLDRKTFKSEIDNMEMTLMPGFRASWFYNKQLQPKSKFVKETYPQSILLRKYVNN